MPKRNNFRPDVQGLRGVAVLFVVLYHAGVFGFGGGYIGVDIFFVISGYLITGLLLREIETSGTLRFVEFYARRARRLVPAATVVLLATTAIAWLLYSPLELKQFTTSAFATAFYLSNFWFAYLSTDYMSEGTDANPLLHTWSLGVEEQFYVVWPLLLILVAKCGAAASLRTRMLCLLGGLTALSFLLSFWLTDVDQPWAFFSSPTRAWEFAVGGLIALWRPSMRLQGPLMVKSIGVAGLMLILGATVFMSDKTPFPGAAALLPVLGAAFVIASGHVSPTLGLGGVLGVRPLRFLGDISYSLYLWHWPVFVFLALEYTGSDWTLRVVGFAISLALAWLSYVLVENPIRFNRVLIARTAASVAMAVLLLALSGGVTLGLRYTAISTLASETYRGYMAASRDVPDIYDNGCQADYLTVEPPNCVFGVEDATTTVVLFGDSHAAQWLPALEPLAERESWRVVLLTKSSCPSMSYSTYLLKMGRAYLECDEWRERAFERIAELKPALTILANSSETTANELEDRGTIDAKTTAAGWAEATRRTLSKLSSISRATVIIKDTPWLRFNGPTCLSRAAWRGIDPERACQFKPNGALAEAVFEIESGLVAGDDQAYVVDMTDAICPSAPCRVERDGQVLYRDFHHLTASFAEQLSDQLYSRIAPIIHGATVTQLTVPD